MRNSKLWKAGIDETAIFYRRARLAVYRAVAYRAYYRTGGCMQMTNTDIGMRTQALIERAQAEHDHIIPTGDWPFTEGVHGELIFWFSWQLENGTWTTGIIREEIKANVG
jgi:hypothetical protein